MMRVMLVVSEATLAAVAVARWVHWAGNRIIGRVMFAVLGSVPIRVSIKEQSALDWLIRGLLTCITCKGQWAQGDL